MRLRTHVLRRITALLAAVLAATLLIGNVPALADNTRTASISGTVSAPASVDVSAVTVSARPEDPQLDWGWASVASDGTYQINGLAAGSYKLHFSGDASGAESQWFANASSHDAATAITVTDGQEITGIDAALAKAASISGKITVPTGIDATSVHVSVTSSSAEYSHVKGTSVEADGSYRLPGLAAGSYKLRFLGNNSGVIDQWYNNAATFAEAATLELAQGQDLSGIDAALAKGASVSGRITAPVGTELHDLQVSAHPLDSQYSRVASVQVDTDGTYRLSGLPAGSYKLQFAGYQSNTLKQWYNNAESFSAANAIELASGQDLTGIDATLVRGASIKGTITVPAGISPAGTHVTVYEANSQWSGTNYSASVAANGSYQVNGLRAGSYKIRVEGGGTGAMSEWYNDADSFMSATPVTVVAEQDVTGVDITLAKSASIGGTVSAPAGVNVGAVRVTAYADGNSASVYAGSTSVGTDGVYRLSGLTAGSYKLQFTGSNSGALSQWFNNATSFETAQAVSVAEGQDADNVNAALLKGASISGKITMPAGSNAAYTYATAYHESGIDREVGYSPVAADGTYRMAGLAAGSYKIQFMADRSGALTQWYNNAPSRGSADVVELAEGQDLTEINATLAKGGTISGKISVPAGVNVSQLNVTAHATGSSVTPVISTYVGADGSYTLVGLPEESYKLQFWAGNSGAVTQWYNNAPTADTATVVAVTAGQNVAGIDASLAKGATISGKVTAPAGVDLTNISVNADSADGKSTHVAYAWVSADGTYRLSGLAEGSYKLRFSANGSGAVNQWYSNASSASAADSLSLTAGQDLTDINVTMVKGATISGKLTGLAEGARYPVTVMDAAGEPVGYGYSGTDGTYSVTGLAAGTYKVAFNRSSGQSLAEAQFYQGKAESAGVGAATPVAVSAGEDVSGKDGSLVVGGSLSGTVKDNSGAVLAGAQVQAYTRDGSKVTRAAGTDSQGKFNVTGLTTGEYLLAVTPPIGRAELGMLYSGNVAEEAAAVAVSATVGAETPAGDLTYGKTAPAPINDPKAVISLDPAKPAEAAVRLDNSASTVSVDYHVIVNGDLTRPKLTVGAGQQSDLNLSGLTAKSTIDVRIYGDGKGTGTRLATATTPDTAAVPETSFTDAHQSGFQNAITWMKSRGISTGYEDGTYRPFESVSREAMAAFVYRLAGKPDYTAPAESPFTDVNTEHGFYKEIAWMKASGLSTGWSDGTYRPYDLVSREAMAAFMKRYAGVFCHLPGAADFVAPTSPTFVDSKSSGFYKEIEWMGVAKVSTGWEDGTYRPFENVTREAMAAFMQRLDTHITASGGCAP